MHTMKLENRYYRPTEIQQILNNEGFIDASAERATVVSRRHIDRVMGGEPSEDKRKPTPRQIAAVSLHAPELASGEPLVYIDESTGLIMTPEEQQSVLVTRE